MIAAGDLQTGTVSIGIICGMVVLSCIPTTIASNVVMTRFAGGDVSAAIVEVVIGNTVGAFISAPLIYVFLPNIPEFDVWQPASPGLLGYMYANVAKQLGLAVLLPLVVGQLIQWRWLKQVTWVLNKFYLAKVSTLCLILIVW